MKSATKLQIGKMLIPATCLSMLIAFTGLYGTHYEASKIDCNSDSNTFGYNQPPYGNDKYPSDTIEGKKQYCNSEVQQANDFVSNNTILVSIFFPIIWGLTIYLIVSGKKGLEQDKKNYKDPSHGKLPKGWGT